MTRPGRPSVARRPSAPRRTPPPSSRRRRHRPRRHGAATGPAPRAAPRNSLSVARVDSPRRAARARPGAGPSTGRPRRPGTPPTSARPRGGSSTTSGPRSGRPGTAPVRRLGDRFGERDDVEPAIRTSGVGRDEALEEQVAELLVMAVELAVGGDQDAGGGSPSGIVAAEPRGDPLAGEPIGVGRRLRLERDRRRQAGVVEDDDDRAPVAQLDPIRPAVSMPGRPPATGRGSCSGLPPRRDPERRQIDGRLGQPQPGRPRARSGSRIRGGPSGSRSADRRPTPAAGSSD